MTLLARDEADIVEAQLAYHLAAGVDFVIATDHRSVDGTTEILDSFASHGSLRLIREDAERIRQADWVTRMARMAAIEYGADWVINSDADVFWWPRGGTLKEVLARVPDRYGVVHGLQQNFAPRPGEDWFAERMILRIAPSAPITDPASPFRPATQVIHRADPDIEVVQGNHDVRGARRGALRGWHPFEILHFPLRSRSQCARKHRNTIEGWERNLRGDLARARSFHEQGWADAYWNRVVIDDVALARGLTDGSLVEDTRLRDVLRQLRGASELPAAKVVEWPSPAVDSVGLAIQSAALADAVALRACRRLDEVARRVHGLEARSRGHSHQRMRAGAQRE